MYAIASALEGKSRDQAARCAGMDRQALRDAVVRHNAEGLDGLYDRERSGRPRFLREKQEAQLAKLILKGRPGKGWHLCLHARRSRANHRRKIRRVVSSL